MGNIIGNKYNKLTVLNFEKKELRKNRWRYFYKCQCECGKIVVVNRDNIVSGKTKTCGCSRKEVNIKHNLCHSRIYKIYNDMKKRCYNENSKSYKSYGERGIIICKEWLNDFINFYNWSIKNGYADNLSIDRIDVNGNYEPNNCRWATQKEQANNTRRNRYLTYKGETHTISEWSDIFNLKSGTIRARLAHGYTPEQALEMPINKYNKIKNLKNKYKTGSY